MIGADDTPETTKLEPSDLKEIAMKARANKHTEVKESEPVDPAAVDKHLSEIIQFMINAAEEGKLEFTYPLESHEMMEAVSMAVREHYPNKLMITKVGGTKELILNWSGKNEV